MKYDSYLHLLTCWEQKKKRMSKLLLKEIKKKLVQFPTRLSRFGLQVFMLPETL